MHRILILGAGFGGLELATRLSNELADDVDVVLIDKSDSFVFGFAKLDVMFGRKSADAVRMFYSDIDKPGVSFYQETIESIDPVARRVVTDRRTHDADFLVVALGADLDPDATPGLKESGYEFYTLAGAARLRDILPSFQSGEAIVSVLGPFFKCPAAPYETALMLHDLLTGNGVRGSTSIKILTPLAAPIPISTVASERIVAACQERGIEFWPESTVKSLEPRTHIATLGDGREISYDLFLGVPIHRAPAVVEESGLAVDGWIPIDTTTFETRFPNVFAVGDVTSAPVPRVGVMAESEADIVADVLFHRLRGGPPPTAFQGKVRCYIEFGGPVVAQFDANFLGGPRPTSQFAGPSVEFAESKREFGSSRRARWFGTEEV